MAKGKKESVYNYRVFIINNKNDIYALNEFLSSSDNSICGVRYYDCIIYIVILGLFTCHTERMRSI